MNFKKNQESHTQNIIYVHLCSFSVKSYVIFQKDLVKCSCNKILYLKENLPPRFVGSY